jgi:hypothetical protein
LGEIDGRVEDHVVTALDPTVDQDLAAEIANHADLAQIHDAILGDGNLEAALVEDDGVGRDPRSFLIANLSLERS